MAIRIAVFAALPQETAPILRPDAGWRRVAGKPFPISAHQSPGGETLLVETGIGTQRAAQAARYIAKVLLSATPPDLMISVGFAGALSGRLTLGQTDLHEMLVEVAVSFNDAEAARLDDQQVIGNLIQEVAVVTDEDNRAVKLL